MRKITAKDAKEIKISDQLRDQYKMSIDDMNKEILNFENVACWPLWPILPMKNVMWRHLDFRLPWSAVMIAMGDNDGKLERRVYLAGAYDLKELYDIRDKVEFLEYPTWKEMLDAGWRID